MLHYAVPLLFIGLVGCKYVSDYLASVEDPEAIREKLRALAGKLQGKGPWIVAGIAVVGLLIAARRPAPAVVNIHERPKKPDAVRKVEEPPPSKPVFEEPPPEYVEPPAPPKPSKLETWMPKGVERPLRSGPALPPGKIWEVLAFLPTGKKPLEGKIFLPPDGDVIVAYAEDVNHSPVQAHTFMTGLDPESGRLRWTNRQSVECLTFNPQTGVMAVGIGNDRGTLSAWQFMEAATGIEIEAPFLSEKASWPIWMGTKRRLLFLQPNHEVVSDRSHKAAALVQRFKWPVKNGNPVPPLHRVGAWAFSRVLVRAPITVMAHCEDPSIVLTGATDNLIRVWRYNNGSALFAGGIKVATDYFHMPSAIYAGHTQAIRVIRPFPSNHYKLTVSMASSKAGYELHLWETLTGKPMYQMKIPAGEITACDLSRNIRYSLTADRSGTVTLWDHLTKSPIEHFSGSGTVTQVAFSPDYRRAYAVYADQGTVAAFALPTLE